MTARGGKSKCRTCHALVQRAGYCPACKASNNADARDRRAEGRQEAEAHARRMRSTRAWTLASRAHRADNPWCADPFGVHGSAMVPADHVHHIVAITEDDSKAFDTANMQSLCRKCHSRVEKRGQHGV